MATLIHWQHTLPFVGNRVTYSNNLTDKEKVSGCTWLLHEKIQIRPSTDSMPIMIHAEEKNSTTTSTTTHPVVQVTPKPAGDLRQWEFLWCGCGVEGKRNVGHWGCMGGQPPPWGCWEMCTAGETAAGQRQVMSVSVCCFIIKCCASQKLCLQKSYTFVPADS